MGMEAFTRTSDGNEEKDIPSLLNYISIASRNKRYNPILFLKPGYLPGYDVSALSFLQSSNKAKPKSEYYGPIENPPDALKKPPTIRFLNLAGLLFYYL